MGVSLPPPRHRDDGREPTRHAAVIRVVRGHPRAEPDAGVRGAGGTGRGGRRGHHPAPGPRHRGEDHAARPGHPARHYI